MVAEIVSVGTELLLGQISDTNAQYLGAYLPEFGIGHHFRQTVGDNPDRITAALQLALSRSDIVFTIGGLGPTEDDLTRDMIAKVTGVELALVEEELKKIRALFELRKLKWVDSIAKQAYVPMGAKTLPNENGTAPGLLVEWQNKRIIALPGPKSEFVAMLEGPVREYLARLSSGGYICSTILRITGMGESSVEEQLLDLMSQDNPTVAPYAKPGEVHLRITARGMSEDAARNLLAPVEQEIRNRLGSVVYGKDANTLETVILEMLRQRGERLAVAESCTGGGLGYRLTSVPGASDVFLGGVISYANSVKHQCLEVPEANFSEDGVGAVSTETAIQMAIGVQTMLGANWSLSITGVAGPGQSERKPAGLVYIAVSGPMGVHVTEHRFRGNRETVRERSIQSALNLIYQELIKWF